MIEIQIHPSDIRRRVRYLFFDRRRVLLGIIASTFLLAIVIGSMAAAPTVIRRVYKNNFAFFVRQVARTGGTGVVFAACAPPPLDWFKKSSTLSFSSGEMLARAEFLRIMPTLAQASMSSLLSILSSLARAKIRIFCKPKSP